MDPVLVGAISAATALIIVITTILQNRHNAREVKKTVGEPNGHGTLAEMSEKSLYNQEVAVARLDEVHEVVVTKLDDVQGDLTLVLQKVKQNTQKMEKIEDRLNATDSHITLLDSIVKTLLNGK